MSFILIDRYLHLSSTKYAILFRILTFYGKKNLTIFVFLLLNWQLTILAFSLNIILLEIITIYNYTKLTASVYWCAAKANAVTVCNHEYYFSLTKFSILTQSTLFPPQRFAIISHERCKTNVRFLYEWTKMNTIQNPMTDGTQWEKMHYVNDPIYI